MNRAEYAEWGSGLAEPPNELPLDAISSALKFIGEKEDSLITGSSELDEERAVAPLGTADFPFVATKPSDKLSDKLNNYFPTYPDDSDDDDKDQIFETAEPWTRFGKELSASISKKETPAKQLFETVRGSSFKEGPWNELGVSDEVSPKQNPVENLVECKWRSGLYTFPAALCSLDLPAALCSPKKLVSGSNSRNKRPLYYDPQAVVPVLHVAADELLRSFFGPDFMIQPKAIDMDETD